jgi:hypothetical protein
LDFWFLKQTIWQPWSKSSHCFSGFADGLFSLQKSQFEFNIEGLGMENVDIFYDHFEYFAAIWYIL